MNRDLAMTPASEQDPARATAAMLRDLAEAVAEVAGRMFDLPPEEAA